MTPMPPAEPREELVTVHLTRLQAASLHSSLWLRFGTGSWAPPDRAPERHRRAAILKLRRALDDDDG